MQKEPFKAEANILSLDCYHELSLLKCILQIDNRLIFKAKASITAQDFIKLKNGKLFDILSTLIIDQKERVDFVIVATYIQEHQTGLMVSWLTDICEAFATLPLFPRYILQVKANATKVKLLDFAYRLNELNTIKGSFDDWLHQKDNQFKTILSYFTQSKLTNDICLPDKTAAEAIDFYTDKTIKTKTIVKTGFDKFDNITGGLHTLTILSAPTGMGKTCYSLNVFTNLSYKQKIPCLYVNYEMEKNEIRDRITSILTGIDNAALCKKEEINIPIVLDTFIKIKADKSLVYTGNEGKTISDTCSLIYQTYNTHKIKVVFIDYIGEIEPDEQALKERSEYITYGRYAQTLKNVCAELGIKCFLVTQISREGDENPGRKHIQGSWKLVQKADLFAILCNEYDRDGDGNKIPNSKTYKLKIEKNRHGKTPAQIKLMFNKQTHTFTEDQLPF